MSFDGSKLLVIRNQLAAHHRALCCLGRVVRRGSKVAAGLAVIGDVAERIPVGGMELWTPSLHWLLCGWPVPLGICNLSGQLLNWPEFS